MRLRLCLLGGLALLCASPAAADEPGTLRGVVFSPAGAPAAGVAITAGPGGGEGAGATSNEDGAFTLTLPPGSYRLKVASRPAAGEAVRVVAGETTEVLVTLAGDGGPARLQVEAPGAARQRRPRRAKEPKVAVRGSLTDAVKGKPVAGARVFARGTTAEAVSAADGTFAIKLPAGQRELTVIHPGFSTEQVPLEVKADGSTPAVELKLVAAAAQLADFTVMAPRIVGGTAGLLEARREASTVTDIIGAEQMSKSGDSDAAAALGRVPGITVVGGKYVYIRGLGERYSATVLNLSTLPSPEPERRVVPLDMFPVGVLEEITIQKTYTPDLPGDFSGGMVKLSTRGFPADFTASVSASVGFNDVAALQEGTGHGGGGLDWLTFGAGDRQLPDAVKAAGAGQQIQPYNKWTRTGLTDAELERLGEAMANNWATSEQTLAPDLGLSATLGDSFRVRGQRIGYLLALGYGNEWRHTVRDSLLPNVAVGAGEELEIFDNLRARELLHEVKLSAIGNAGLDLAGQRHKLRLTALMVRIGEDETRLIEGFDRDLGANKRGTRIWYRERMLLFDQISGQHGLLRLSDQRALGLQLDWRYAFSMATLDEPDRRSTRYDEQSAGAFELSSRSDSNQRFYSTLQDLNHDLSADLTASFRQWGGLKTSVKAGFNVALGDRDVDTRRFTFTGRPSDTSILARPPEQIFVPDTIGPGGFTLSENTRGTDDYSSTQRLWALYLLADLPLLRSISVLVGARVEQMYREVLTVDPFDSDPQPIYGPCNAEDVARCTDRPDATTDLLPAAILSYRPWGPTHVFRLGYSRTLNRPQIRELSPSPFDDPDTGIQYEGNPRLRQAVLDNVDLRWEWYPGRMESISVATFYKRFSDPIEVIAITSAAVTVTPDNAEGADNVGAEIEAHKKLGFIHRALRDVTVGGNASVIFSRVSLDPARATAVTNLSRPLQGQSPWVFNVFASYDNVESGTVVRALYNVFGPRIAAVGTNGVPDTYEQPYHRLDLVASQRVWERFTVSLAARNLINRKAEWTLTDDRTGKVFVVDGYRPGRVFSLSLSASY